MNTREAIEDIELNIKRGAGRKSLDLAIEALERLTPKKPNGDEFLNGYWCPRCGIDKPVRTFYCSNCGQHLDWDTKPKKL